MNSFEIERLFSTAPRAELNVMMFVCLGQRAGEAVQGICLLRGAIVCHLDMKCVLGKLPVLHVILGHVFSLLSIHLLRACAAYRKPTSRLSSAPSCNCYKFTESPMPIPLN